MTIKRRPGRPTLSDADAELVRACRDDAAARVDVIAEIMRAGRWVRGRTGNDVARLWGLSVSRVQDLSAEASRRVRAEATNATK